MGTDTDHGKAMANASSHSKAEIGMSREQIEEVDSFKYPSIKDGSFIAEI